MRITERLTKLKQWVTDELCTGRVMKAPGPNMDISQIERQEPRCYLAWAPSRMDSTGNLRLDPASIVPGILIMPNPAFAKYVEEKRYDRYENIHREQELGQHINVSILFSVYEPGVRLPGFIDGAANNGKNLDLDRIQEGTEQGLMTLMNWMDDCMSKLLGARFIPHTDMFVEEATMMYSLYKDQEYVVDKRPIYYGFVNVSFACFANETINPQIESLLGSAIIQKPSPSECASRTVTADDLLD